MPIVRSPCTLRVPAHRARPGAGLADVAAQQQQVHQHLDGGDAAPVLGDAHAPADDRRACCRRRARAASRESARAQARLALRCRSQRGRARCRGQRLEARGVLRDEVRGRRASRVRRIDASSIAGRARRGRRRCAAGSSARRSACSSRVSMSSGLLRIGEALQPALAQRVEGDDAAAALGRRAQLAEHARVVGAGVLAEHEDRVGLLEVLERDRALAAADLLDQRDARGLVAHVRAVRQVVGAELAHEQLVQERGLVARCGPRCRTAPRSGEASALQRCARSARRPRPRRSARSGRWRRRSASARSAGPAPRASGRSCAASSATVCAAKNVRRRRASTVASAATALTPFSQNSKVECVVAVGPGAARAVEAVAAGWCAAWCRAPITSDALARAAPATSA